MGTDRFLFSQKTRPSKEREEERKRESERKERAKMGTDRFLWSVVDI